MVKQIISLCDVHLERDEEVSASPIRIGLDDAKPIEVDLCKECAKEFVAPLRELIERVGQPVQTSVQNRLPCPECGKSYKTKDSLAKHQRSMHGVLSPAAPTPAAKHICPDCQQEFSTPQGMGAHRHRKHGYVSPNAGPKQAKDEAAAAPQADAEEAPATEEKKPARRTRKRAN